MPGAFGRDKGIEEKAFTDRLIHPEAALTLKAHEQFVYASTTGTAFTITMPRPEACAGKVVAIFMVARSSTDDITIAGEGFTDVVLNAAAEHAIFISIGKDWIEFPTTGHS